jgi:uncharacterized damage-inducible protein DinB
MNADTRYLQRLFAYDDWANREVLRGLRASQTERSRKLLAHILSAERLWWQRLGGKPQTLPVWPDLGLDQCESEIAALALDWKRELDGNTDLAREIAYRNSKGESFLSHEDDILLHVITHSAYHRGQIAADLRAAGIAPAYTDFIHAVRQGFIE